MNRLDNTNRLVITYIKILNLLYKESLSVNEIITQTSPDRTFVINALKTLEKNGFIEPIEFEKQHKQKKFKNLSKLGKELAHFTFNIENFNLADYNLHKVIDGYKELDKKIHEYQERYKEIKNTEEKQKNKPVSMTNKTPFRRVKGKNRNLERFLQEKLKEKEWTDTEIRYYDDCKEGLYYTDIYLHEGMIKIVLGKFLSIIDNLDLNVGAREIINQIIIEIFQIQLSAIVNNTHSRYSKYLKNHNNTNDYSSYYPSFKNEPLEYMDKLRFPFTSSVREIVEKMMICYLNLLNPSKEIIEYKLKSIEKNIENAQINKLDDETDNDDTNNEKLKMYSSCLMNVYNKYLISK